MEEQTPNEARLERILVRLVEKNGYHENSNNGRWQTWILNIVGTLIAGLLAWNLTQILSLREDVAAVRATQIANTAASQERATRVDERLDHIESKIWRGSP